MLAKGQHLVALALPLLLLWHHSVADAAAPQNSVPYTERQVVPDTPFALDLGLLKDHWTDADTSQILSFVPTATQFLEGAPAWLTAALSAVTLAVSGDCNGLFISAVVSYSGLHFFAVSSTDNNFGIGTAPNSGAISQISSTPFSTAGQVGVDL